MIGRLLCRIGRHRWDYTVHFIFDTYDECGRCGTRKSVSHS